MFGVLPIVMCDRSVFKRAYKIEDLAFTFIFRFHKFTQSKKDRMKPAATRIILSQFRTVIITYVPIVNQGKSLYRQREVRDYFAGRTFGSPLGRIDYQRLSSGKRRTQFDLLSADRIRIG